MVDLNASDWKEVRAASGNIPQLLGKLKNSTEHFPDVVDTLMENLSHQLSFYTATAYALPHLAELGTTLSTDKKIYLLATLGPAVAAEGTEPLDPDSALWREFQEGLAPLRLEMKTLILKHMDALKALSSDLQQQFAVSALALLGERKRAFYLYLYAGWEEFPAACANDECDWCEECMDLSLEEEPELTTPVSLEPWDGVSLEREEVWFPGLLEKLGDEDILPRLPYLYGTCTCPVCGASGLTWEWIDRFYEEDF